MKEMQLSPPSDLVKVQKFFAEVISLPIQKVTNKELPVIEKDYVQEIEKAFTDGIYLNSKERLSIYRQQYWYRLLSILQEDLPSLTRLFGYKSFNKEIAEPYLIAFPPMTWSLQFLAKDFLLWVDKYYQESDKELIYYCSLLDTIYNTLFYAEKTRLLSKEDLFSKKLFLQEFVELIAMPRDYLHFREKLVKNEPHYFLKNPFPELDDNKTCVVIYKEDRIIKSEVLQEEEFSFLSLFTHGITLEDALEKHRCCDRIVQKCTEWVKREWFTVASTK